MLDKSGIIKHSLLLFLLLLHFNGLFASLNDTTTINKYSQIIAVFDENISDPDSIVVTDASEFEVANTIVVYQAKGMGWDIENNGYNGEYAFAGRFELHMISHIVGDTIIFPSSLTKETDLKFRPEHMMQVVKVPSLSKYVVNSTLTASPWDGKKGGILALVVDTLDLQANIDVSGKGFLGADPGTDYFLGTCSLSDSAKYSKNYYTINGKDSAGLKGESVVLFENNYRRGIMCWGNGGGGGNGRHSGGGGGSNRGFGGNGGVEAKPCNSNLTTPGIGGVNFSGTKFTSEVRASFGGGGGCSTQESPFRASKGGNGGGIVLLLANVVVGNGFYIIANGQDVNDICTAGGGGGGGGGSILFDVNKVEGQLNLLAKGGKGGTTKGYATAEDAGGAGGGGGGGIVFYNGLSVSANIDVSRGLRGSSYQNDAANGIMGDTRSELLMPVKDFLFNVMPASQEICAGEAPKLFEASKPKGGNGTYKYKWLRSTDLITWDSVGNTRTFQESALYDTTYYKRIVISFDPNGDSIIDKGTMLTIKVPPAISNNTITSDGVSALCEGKPLPLIRGTSTTLSLGAGVISGGNGNYKYLWQDTGTWTNVPGKNDTVNYQPSQTDTVHLRRVVKSGVCTSYSNIVTINVLANIKGNVVADTQWISLGYLPKKLTQVLPGPSGGDIGNYTYKWSQSFNKSTWSDAPSTNSNIDYVITLPNHNPDTFYYRRTVFSGQNNTCESKSNIITIYVLDSIHDNIIYGDDTICALTSPVVNFYDKKAVTGGDGIYLYQWEKSENNVVWDSLTTISERTYNPGVLLNTTYFRRIVLSGNRYACKDTSNSIEISVRPSIKENYVIWPKNDTIICFNQKTDSVIMHKPVDGDGPYKYTWQVSTDKNSWSTAEGISYRANYKSDNLNTTVFFRRKVESGVCLNYSDTLHVNVLPLITKNSITSAQYVCKYSAPSLLVGSAPSNGDGKSYKYKWLKSLDNLNWIAAPGNDTSVSYQPDTTSQKLYFRRIVMSGLSDCCKDTSSAFLIQIHDLPTSTLTDFDDSICLGSDYELQFNFTGKNNYSLTYSDGSKQTSITDLSGNLLKTTIKPDKSGIFNYSIVSLSDGNGCVAQTKTGAGKLSVFTIPKAFAGNDTSVCGLIANLSAIPSVGKGQWSTNFNTEFTSGYGSANQQIKVPDYGIYTYTWKENNGGCIDEDSVNITYYNQPLTVNAGENLKGNYLFRTALKAEPAEKGIGIGTWSSPDETIIFENDTIPNTYVSNLKFGDNFIVWTRTNGVCNAIKDTVIVSTGDIKVPNGFSPNNDRVNDKFEIIGLDQVKDANLVILNKWGLKVFESGDYKNDWDGTYKGNNLPEDSYFYILNVIGKTYKGVVTIRR